ncbi:MAG: hypothetical protein OXC48_00585 [Endozoicomonadaceae bacterium]|nr:hypothetical protein [Endozoicomonadaceae bacterium]
MCPWDTSFACSEFPGIHQLFYISIIPYTALNRIDQVKEILQNSMQQQASIKIMLYQYTNPSVPLRIQRIISMWNQNALVV